MPFECRTSPLKVVDGRIKVPTGPGFGVDIDPAFVAKHRPVTGDPGRSRRAAVARRALAADAGVNPRYEPPVASG